MITELRVRDLGVIEDVRLDLGPGMTALTGETGAGKTLIVEALELLLGGRADPLLVRPGASEAFVEGRFVTDDEVGDEVILARAIPAGGRSRAWIDGRMAPVSALAEIGAKLVDLHGQHAHQSLLDPASQRRALDSFGGIDQGPLAEARAQLTDISSQLESIGGDERARAREADLLRYQLEEIEAAAITGPGEDEELEEEEERLAEAGAHREAAAMALGSLDSDQGSVGAVDLVGRARAAIESRPVFARLVERLAASQAELVDMASDLRSVVETWEDDPSRLAEIQARRQLLRDLSRKYGEGPAGVLSFATCAAERLRDLESTEERALVLNARLAKANQDVTEAEAAVAAARRSCAGRLARALESRLRSLAMPKARVQITVGDQDPGDEVRFGLGANPGEPVLSLAKVASGGELARAMLALRLVLSEAPPTMVFDEVDAGVGGEAATVVGASLAELAQGHQVLVVTHLAQVAAYADHQIGVTKVVDSNRTVARAAELQGDQRVTELARMLSGRPESETARRHAEELLRAGRSPTADAAGGNRRRQPGSTGRIRASSTVG